MSDRSPIVLCSGSLGSVPLDEKIRAAAEAGFGWVSLYRNEYRAAIDNGVDLPEVLRECAMRVAEVDGAAISMQSFDGFADALAIAVAVDARSITIVETGAYDPTDEAQIEAAVDAFGRHCDLAERHGILVHIEPYAWSSLSRTGDCATIINGASRANGGMLLDLWHLLRGPDQGQIDPMLDPSSIFEIQLADTLAEPWDNIRDECMGHRQLPGDGHARLAERVADLAATVPLPLVGIELFGSDPVDGSAARVASECRDAVARVLADAAV